MKKCKKISRVLLVGMITCLGLSSAWASDLPTPQSDYYEYVNQEWLKETKIPAHRSSVSNFYFLNEETEAHLRSLLHDYNANYDELRKGSDLKKLITYYRMAKDFKKRDELGFEPVKPYLKPIEEAKNIKEFNETVINLAKDGMYGPITFYIYPDEKKNDKNILYIGTPGLGLPKEYLLGQDEYSKQVRAGYEVFLVDLFKLAGEKETVAKEKSKMVLELSKQEAAAILPKEKQSERELFYNVKTWDEIKKLAPAIPYTELAQSLGLEDADKIVVTEPQAIVKMNELYTKENLPALKAQLESFVLQSQVGNLSKEGIEAAARFHEALTGVYNVYPDDRLAYNLTDSNMGEILGELYVDTYFPETSKQDVLNMVHEIQNAYKTRLKTLDWMSDKTKEQAREKIDAMTVKIGYPDEWTDYSTLEIKPYEEGSNLVENSIAISRFYQKLMIEELNKAPNKSEWGMTPQTINAYYNPTFNEIVFPAAILQAPFYDANASKEANLGAIGAVIGHEISHAFDVSGAQYDKFGNLNNWWQEDDYARFKKKVDKAAKFYSHFEVLPGYFVNGEISTGEIFGDLGGVTIAIAIAEAHNLDTKKVFEAYAKVWRNKMTEQALIGRLIDEHPPGKYRVNGIVQQIQEFYDDYNVKPGDGMYIPPQERFKVW